MSDSSAVILKAIEEAPAPITFAAVQKRTRMPTEDLRKLLADEVGRQRIHRWPGSRGSQRFWRRAAEEVVREETLALAAEHALPSGELAKRVRKRVAGYPAKLIASTIQQLLREQHLRKYPGFGRGGVLLGSEGHPAAYALAARDAIADIVAKLRAGGAGELEVRLALGIPEPQPAHDLEQEILQAMRAIEPQPTTPVSVRELRQALPKAPKQELDQAALRLRSSGKAYLSRHDFPQSLSDPDRDMLIDGGDGSYYVAITARSD